MPGMKKGKLKGQKNVKGSFFQKYKKKGKTK
jgi:hypothetical protein